MTEVAEKPQDKAVSIINQGGAPMDTLGGRLMPGQSIDVPASEAAKLCRAYAHIKLASDIVPSSKANESASAENAALKAKVAELEGQIVVHEAKVEDLSGRLQEFLDAGSKKDLDALQEKHAEAVEAKA